ncbi:hypothetical protein I314_04970 [Cryptococcus bacillisporus CA1873]|uniref:Uncharacterized protein n=1 Tax=Cryptococcus bacillisporus CA1873 TaxID=1296111 RepID=A0ABR5B5W2_CRYGA|nr:hypothetical protein I314_04970 [Cryptococcus bacillisporus CA1873]|eukprot:KIR58986.1 hypothetical protein I314_04970 [Cryptococcus gattii CA1873]
MYGKPLKHLLFPSSSSLSFTTVTASAMANRDSLLSTCSSTTYPLTWTSLSMSALGLTDSLLPSRSKDPSPAGSTPPSPSRRPAIRASASKSSLRQEATTNAAARLVAQQQSATFAPMSRQRASQVDLKEDVASYQTPKPPTPAKSPSTRPSEVKSTSVFQDAQHPAQRKAAQITTRTNLVTRKAVPSPAHTEITLADEWEAELEKDAQKLNLGPSPQKPHVVREPREQRPNDGEWERFGQETSTAREEEDRRRREPGTEVAFPPSMPRTPIRAVAAGLSGEETHPSYTAKHNPDLPKKAQREYEDWLAKKAEREGDMESGGMRNWEPKERAIARPSDLSPHSANSLHTASPAELPPTDMASWTYGYPHSHLKPVCPNLENLKDISHHLNRKTSKRQLISLSDKS